MSEEQAKVLSCLLEIDLTLTVAGLREDRLRGRSHSPAMEDADHLPVLMLAWRVGDRRTV
jgi:hypothetical protein